MKKLFLTTALVFPLALTPALAQQAVVPAPDAAQDDSAVTEPMADPAADPAADPMADPAADPAADPMADPAADPAADPMADPAADSTTGAMDAAPAADAAADAADQAADAADEAAAVATDPDKIVQQQAANELRLDWVTGATVTSPDGETIGNVTDLILDRESGMLSAAVIGVGGFLGIGEKKIAVPWERLTVDYDANQITSDLSRDEADAAPEYVFRDRESMPAPVDAGMDAGMGTTPAPIQ